MIVTRLTQAKLFTVTATRFLSLAAFPLDTVSPNPNARTGETISGRFNKEE